MANWKETVMEPNQIATLLLGISDRYYDAETIPTVSDLAIATAQAKLTWEARDKEVAGAEKQGYDKGYTEARNHCEDILLPQERLEGRKEVVEWIKPYLIKQLGIPIGYLILGNDLEAQLKEWGIEH